MLHWNQNPEKSGFHVARTKAMYVWAKSTPDLENLATTYVERITGNMCYELCYEYLAGLVVSYDNECCIPYFLTLDMVAVIWPVVHFLNGEAW